MLSCSFGRRAVSGLVPLSIGFLLAPAGGFAQAPLQKQQCTASNCQSRSRHSSSSYMAGRTYVVEPRGKHSATLIFLHGLGDIGQGWSQSLTSIQSDHVRIVCPTAPTRPVTLNMGMRMPAWFDVFGLGKGAKQDEAGVKAAAENLKELIAEEEKRGVAASRIVIGGFSQGGAVALLAGLTSDKVLGGIAAFSTWLPMHEVIATMSTDAGRSIPILQCHGGSDPMVAIDVGTMSAEALASLTKQHVFKLYPAMQHSSCPEELRDFAKWLDQQIGQAAPL